MEMSFLCLNPFDNTSFAHLLYFERVFFFPVAGLSLAATRTSIWCFRKESTWFFTNIPNDRCSFEGYILLITNTFFICPSLPSSSILFPYLLLYRLLQQYLSSH